MALILVLGALTVAPVTGQSDGQAAVQSPIQHDMHENGTVESTFDDGNEGWTLFSDQPDTEATYRSDGGNPGGHIANEDTKGGDTWYYDAPDAFLGDKSEFYDGALMFDMKKRFPRGDNYYDSFTIGAHGDITLQGDNRSISYDLGGAARDPGQNWSTFSVPLNASGIGWVDNDTQEQISESEMKAVLADLDGMLIRGEWRTGSDASSLDNVKLDANGSAEIRQNGQVNLDVSMDGEPADARIYVYPQDAPDTTQAVRYTDLDNPGTATFDLPAGEYRLQVDAGGNHLSEYEHVNVTVPSGDTVEASVELTQLYEPNDRGWYGVDTHSHSPWSNNQEAHDSTEPDEAIPGSPNTRGDAWVAAQLGAQLDAVIVSDHDLTVGHAPVKERATARNVPYILSQEISATNSWGHHNAYPLQENRTIDPSGPISEVYADARDAGAEAIQVNHPFYSPGGPPSTDGIGYFTDVNRSGFSYSFDAAEVFNGFTDTVDENTTHEQMYEFWNQGYEFAAVSVSDDHNALNKGPDVGTPRTYAYGDPGAGPVPNGTKFAEAVSNQHTFATYGPLVYFTAADGAIPGETVTVDDGTVTLSADLQNAEGNLTNARLVRNGTVVEEFDLDSREDTISYDAAVDGNSWFVLHVRDEKRDRAMTSPIYVESDGETTPAPDGDEFDVVLSDVSRGLQSFNMTAAAQTNVSVSDVESDLLPSRFLQVTEMEDGSTMVRGSDIAREVGSSDGEITLATLTFSGEVSEEEIAVNLGSLTDDEGETIDADALTIEPAGPFSAPLPGSGADARPVDHDGDGLYEDVEGDGDVDFDDAVSLTFVEFGSLSEEQQAALDFDGDGSLEFEDAIELAFQA